MQKLNLTAQSLVLGRIFSIVIFLVATATLETHLVHQSSISQFGSNQTRKIIEYFAHLV